ncbi:hypothetical protein FQN60_000893 [Etheostoma spectabile]|uniref:Reverse transcriptase domain-containing protein n=1 Tax=Etheostoma spectabile TaxID=54343 RepID=A0A5J5CZG4_9PERO|nr:hypothetical protein FQN60_000893 [Etheostoma spectabile]
MDPYSVSSQAACTFSISPTSQGTHTSGVEDVALYMLHQAYTYLDVPGSYVRIRFFDFSSVFNTIQPLVVRDKLRCMKTPSLTSWLMDYLTTSLQLIRLGNCVSMSLECSTGAQGDSSGCFCSKRILNLKSLFDGSLYQNSLETCLYFPPAVFNVTTIQRRSQMWELRLMEERRVSGHSCNGRLLKPFPQVLEQGDHCPICHSGQGSPQTLVAEGLCEGSQSNPGFPSGLRHCTILLWIPLPQVVSPLLLDTILSQDTIMGVYTLLLQSLVLLGLTGEVEGVADARRRHLACTQHLNSQGFSQGLHGLQGLGKACCAAVAQQASLYNDVPLSS